MAKKSGNKKKPKGDLTINVYLDNGVVYQYDVTKGNKTEAEVAAKAREHSDAIIKGGYRHNDGKGEYEHYPPHRISKVKVTGGIIPTKYPDRVSGT